MSQYVAINDYPGIEPETLVELGTMLGHQVCRNPNSGCLSVLVSDDWDYADYLEFSELMELMVASYTN